jgi:hypothetical protein
MTAILDNFAVKVDLTAMAQARDAQFAEMLDEFRAAGEMHVYEGSFAVAWEGLRAFPRPDLENESGWLSEAGDRAHGLLLHRD